MKISVVNVRTTPLDPDVHERLRGICLALPEAIEVRTFGNPTFQAGAKRTFAVLDEYRGEPVIVFKATLASQRSLLEHATFFASPFGAKHGWTCARVSRRIPWARLSSLLLESYRLVALKRMIAELDRG